MAMELRYAGEFLSKAGIVWRCEILQEADAPFGEVGELEFPADEPLVIEWPEKGKEEPLCGSTATLTVISPGDRTYADLYTVKPGTIRLDILRAGILYWSGCLDPEFYEEPYDKGSGYDVTLTFSDFGILDRLVCGLEGSPTIQEYIDTALAASGILYADIDQSMVSTSFTDGTGLTLSSLTVRSDNFVDEDGERSTLAAVLTGLLQPLALKMTQRDGKIWIYDLNGLYCSVPTSEAVWSGTGQTMGTDRVYNNIKVNFSPYGSGGLNVGEMRYTDIYGPEWTNLTKEKEGVEYLKRPVPSGMTIPECYTFYPEIKYASDYSNLDFTIFISTAAESTVFNYALCKWFHVEPILGSEESEGLAWGFYVGHGNLTDLDGRKPVRKGLDLQQMHQRVEVMRTRRVYIPPLGDEAERVWIRLRQEILVDCRYNPFTDATDNNCKANQDYMTTLANLSLVPMSAVIYDSESGGTALCHWTNREITEEGRNADYISNLVGEWEDGDAQFGDAWLMYCDPTSRDTILAGSGLGGWKCNRQNFGIVNLLFWESENKEWRLNESFGRMPDGQYIKYPPYGGWLEIRIYAGVYAYTENPTLQILTTVDIFNEDIENTALYKDGLYSRIRWLLYKIPELSIVRHNVVPDDITDDDVEFSGMLNLDAAEGLSIDTICGSLDTPSPTARGVYSRASSGTQLGVLERAGVTDRPEQLLIGTLYSQYADRRTTLSGEIRTVPGRFGTMTDGAQPAGTILMVVSERQDCISGCSEIKLCELMPDEYAGEI